MTRRDYDEDDDLRSSMRDAFEYLHPGRDAARDSASSRREGVFGDTRDLLGLVTGGALVGLTAGLLGNANLGNTGIPMALIPAGIGYAASYFDVLPAYSSDFKNLATGALVVGTGLWALAQGVRVQAARQAPAVVVAGAPPAAMGAAPPHQQAFAQQYARVGACPPQAYAPPPPYAPPPTSLPAPSFGTAYPAYSTGVAPSYSRSPLSEAEMISIAQRY